MASEQILLFSVILWQNVNYCRNFIAKPKLRFNYHSQTMFFIVWKLTTAKLKKVEVIVSLIREMIASKMSNNKKRGELLNSENWKLHFRKTKEKKSKIFPVEPCYHSTFHHKKIISFGNTVSECKSSKWNHPYTYVNKQFS